MGSTNRVGVRRNGAITAQERPRHRKRLYVDRQLGTPHLTPNTEVAAHLQQLMQYMTLREISRRCGISVGTLEAHAFKTCRESVHILKGTAEPILALQPQPGELTFEERALGISRMIMGLVAKGFPQEVIAPLVGKSVYSVTRHRGKQLRNLSQDYYDRMLAVADKLDTADPLEYSTQWAVNFAKGWAHNRGWPPLGCWDLDTVHMADVTPEWTGKCGTAQGHKVHYRENIPVCPECRDANAIYRRYPRLAVKLGIVNDGHSPEQARAARYAMRTYD